MPAEVGEFFNVAETGDWSAVSNSYAGIQRLNGLTNTSLGLPATSVLSVPLHEVFGAGNEFHRWDGSLLQKYADGVLQSIPAGSVYFGGTDPGRFVITAFHDTANSPELFIITPKYILPQTGQVISGYLDYLRLWYGAQLTLPTEADARAAIQQYVQDVQAGRRPGKLTSDQGVVFAGDPQAIMSIDGLLSRWIFDHNKDAHEFYYEESYVTPWMYPYLEPHGLIMKLDPEPPAQLDPAVVARDREFWSALTKELLTDPGFQGNEAARATYAKLRSGIGGLYQFRRLTSDAEAAFRQAVELCPTSAEAVFRLTDLYLARQRFDEALTVLERYHGRLTSAADREKTFGAITRIRDLKRRLAGNPPNPY